MVQTKPVADQIAPLDQRQEAEPEKKEEEEPTQNDLGVQRQSEEEKETEEGTFQTKRVPGYAPLVAPQIAANISSLRSGGQPLPKMVRAFFEPRFGVNFSDVRVHSSPQATETAKAMNAHAYTLGQNIVFSNGQYSPHTMKGKKLIAHELSHTIQQGALPRRLVRPGQARADVPTADNMPPTIQRAIKFEFQTRNYVWKIDKRGKRPKPIGRKLGRFGHTEKGGEPGYLAVGKQGYPEVRVGDMVKARKKEDYNPKKKSQFIVTYKVTRDPKGKVDLNGVPVIVKRESMVNNRYKKGMKGKYNKGIYKFIYLDADHNNKQMNVHLVNVHPNQREPVGVFQYGRVKRMKKASALGKKKGTKSEVIEEGSAIELQSESKGFIEFETPKWFRSWCALRLRVKEAVDMVNAIHSSPPVSDNRGEIKKGIESQIPGLIKKGKRYSSHPTIGKLKKWPESYPIDRLPLKGGRLLVEEVDPKWKAYIQHSEGIALTQYETLLKEQRLFEIKGRKEGKQRNVKVESAKYAKYAREILKNLNASYKKVPNLYSFLQLICYYIERGQLEDIRKRTGKPGPAKWAFALMIRTSFYSIYHSLPKDEKIWFQDLVKNKKIVPVLNKMNPDLKLTENSNFFKFGHGGGRGPTVQGWLESIFKGRWIKTKKGKKVHISKDLLSPPVGGAAAMGRFELETESGKKDTNLVKFEVRHRFGNVQPATEWLKYAENRFKEAAARGKDKDRKESTKLEYVESSKCPDTYFGHQKSKAEKSDVKKAKKVLK